METIFFPNNTPSDGNYAATIGFFDGVHKGHRFLIEQLKQLAAKKGLTPMVITFAKHPRQVLQQQWQPKLLSTLEEKLKLLETTGIGQVVILQFDVAMSQLSAREFMEQVLLQRLNVKVLLTGYDNRFGHQREEGFNDYVRFGKEMGIEVIGGQALTIADVNVSSSHIRRLLEHGQVEEANRCLGYSYTLSGQVIHGEQIGRRLGFPTANLHPDDPCKLLPKGGVYAVTVSLENEQSTYQGITNIGTRPTFDGHRTTLETHIIDFDGDLYGRRLTIRFIGRLRDEQHFEDATALVDQMTIDRENAIRLINTI